MEFSCLYGVLPVCMQMLLKYIDVGECFSRNVGKSGI